MAATGLSGGDMVETRPSIAEIENWLDQIPDPEIPVISLMDLGVIRVKMGPEEEVFTVTGGFIEVQPDIVTIMAERPLGSNTRSSTVRMASPPWLIGSRAITVSLVMQAAPTGNIMVELWSEIIVIRLMQ